jgi:hypothetical protein
MQLRIRRHYRPASSRISSTVSSTPVWFRIWSARRRASARGVLVITTGPPTGRVLSSTSSKWSPAASRIQAMIGRRARPQADDLGLARGKGQQALATAAEQKRRMRALYRFGCTVVVGDGVVLAGEGERSVGEAALGSRSPRSAAPAAHRRCRRGCRWHRAPPCSSPRRARSPTGRRRARRVWRVPEPAQRDGAGSHSASRATEANSAKRLFALSDARNRKGRMKAS